MVLFNLKSAYRNIKVQRYYSLLHIIGLGIGVAAAIFIFLWVRYEKSFDQFNPEAGHIFRVNNAYAGSDGTNTVWIASPAPLRNIALQNKAVAACVRIGPDYAASVIEYNGKKIFEIGSVTRFVDADFFDFFKLPLLSGNAGSVLQQSNNVVLSASMAKKLFGAENPVGKIVTLHSKDQFVVSGVAKDMPANTSLSHLDIFLPLTFIAGPYKRPLDNPLDSPKSSHTIDDDYGNFDYSVFVRLVAGSDIHAVESQITKVYLDLGGPGVSGNLFVLQSLKDMHLIDEYGSKSTLYLVNAFSWIGLLIVFIACINYVNLSTARALVRLKEVGVKKILGANKLNLLGQFMLETGLLLLAAFMLALALVSVMMPIYQNLSGQLFSMDQITSGFVLKILAVIIGAFLISALYPALLLAGLRPLQFMKGGGDTGRSKYGLRRVLVVFQFAVSGIIIFGTVIMLQQMHFIKTRDIGYNRSLVLTVDMPHEMMMHSTAVLNMLANSHSIEAVTTASAMIDQVDNSSGSFAIEGRKDIDILFNDMEIAPGFLAAMQIKLLQGRDFNGTAEDSGHFLLNETAVKTLNLNNPVGQQVVYNGRKGIVTGVMRDFNFTSLKQKIAPLIVFSRPSKNGNHGGVLYVRAKAGSVDQAIENTKNVFRQYAGAQPFKYDFLDQNFKSAYDTFNRSVSLLNIFSVIAILISGLGLFGLATYTAEAKTKEIGIRKVLGASKKDIVTLISRDFVWLILLAAMIAMPVGSWIMHHWLRNFAYKITIGPLAFIEVVLFMMTVTLAIIGSKALQAASANPVKSLKSE